MATDDWGIDDGWWSSDGHWQHANPDTVAHFRELIGDPAPGSEPRPWFVRRGTTPGIDRPATLELEDGSLVRASAELPGDLPLGYHALHPSDGGPTTPLVVVPDRVPAWPGRTWGVVAQTFALPSPWGLGGLHELRRLGHWLARHGGSVLATSPLGDPVPTFPREPSPYSPSSRRGLDPMIIDLDLLGVAPLAATGGERPTLDRDAAWRAKRQALAAIWPSRQRAHPGPVQHHAVFSAWAERFGAGWPAWPASHRDPGGDVVAAARRDPDPDVAFWQWLDDTAEAQLGALRAELRGQGVSLMGDLPVGFAADGYDAWVDQDVLVPEVTIGAPPDRFNPAGQDWRLIPYCPHRLARRGYEPYLRTLRAQFRRFGGLRIDHVMGLFRVFWIPDGGDATDGTYVRFPGVDLIDLLALEAARADAFVIGEDLGTVERQVREVMWDRGIGTTKVAFFEDAAPEHWPARSLGTLTTHDLPTVHGALDGTDPWHDPELRHHLLDFAGADSEDPLEVTVAAHRRLAGSGSDLVLATLEDVVGSSARVNLPGTIDEYPNWRVPLPVRVEDLDRDPTASAVIGAISDRHHPGRDATDL